MNRIFKNSLIAATALLGSISVQAQNLSFSGGWKYTTVLCQDGLVYATGRNQEGQLGRGTITTSESDLLPVLNSTGTAPMSGIWMVDAGSGGHGIALSFCGDTVWTWGSNEDGQLGDGTLTTSSLPIMVRGVGGVGQLQDIKFITGGNAESYAITEDNYLLSWGENEFGQLGRGTLTASETDPGYVMRGPTDTLKNVTFVDGGDDFSVALLGDGTAYFFGSEHTRNDPGASAAATANTPYASIILDPNGDTLQDIVRLTAGDVFTLLQTASGEVYSFGHNWGGALGNGVNTNAPQTFQVQGIGGTGFLNNVKSLAAGNQHAIAVLFDGKVVTWGYNGMGQLGNGSTVDRFYPDYVMLNATDTLTDVVDISEGDNWSFALIDDGTFYVWGENDNGQLGLTGGNRHYPEIQNTLPCEVGFDVICPVAIIEIGGIVADSVSYCGEVIGTLRAGTQGNYTYRWWLDDELLVGADDAIINLQGAGKYTVEIVSNDTLCDGSPFCGSPSRDSVIISVDALATINDTICMPGPAELVVTQAGGFKWYDQLTGGNLLAIGDTLTTGILTGDTIFYVEDTSLVYMTVGYDVGDTRFGGSPTSETYNASELDLVFNSFTDFTLDSLTLHYADGGSCWDPSASYANSIVLTNNTDGGTQTYPFTLECSATPDTAVRFPVNFTILEGKEYALSLSAISSPFVVHADGANYAADQNFENIIQIIGSTSNDADDHGPFYDLAITFVESCGRTPVYAIDGGAFTTNMVTSDTICAAETATLDAGTAFNSYLWSTAETTQSITVNTAGTYYVTATATGGCFTIDSTIIVASADLTPTLTNDTICAGESAILDPGSYATYDWSTGVTTPTINVSTVNTYAVTVSDVNGCTGSTSMELVVTDLPVLNLEDTSVCTSDALLLTISTGDVYEEYLWSTTETTAAIDVTASGDYDVTVTTDGCSANGTINVGLYASPVVTLSDAQTCEDISITLDAGSGFTQYNWSNGSISQIINESEAADYSVTVTDINGCTDRDTMSLSLLQAANVDIDNQLLCAGESYVANPGAFAIYNWSDLSSAPTLFVDAAGDYSVTVTNDDGCLGVDSFTVTLLPSPVPLLQDTTICVESTITLNPGASGSLSYNWSTTASTQTIDVNTPGTYSVTISNDDNCEEFATMTLTQHPTTTVSIGGDAAICELESLQLDAGNFAFYNWSNGAVGQFTDVSVTGDYSVTVTDVNGCVDSDVMTLTVNELPFIDMPSSITFCPDSSITLDAGIFDTYTWTSGSGSSIDVSASGTYGVTVTDGNGCQADHLTVVDQYAKPFILDDSQTSFCDNTSITVMAASGFSSYLWNDGTSGTELTTSAAGDIHITVTDANCGWRDTVNVTGISAPNIDIPIASYPKCPRAATQIVAVGDAGFYAWSNGEAGQDLTSITVATGDVTYIVTLTDGATGCSDTASTYVSNDPVETFEIADETVCPGSDAVLSAPGATYVSYEWSTGETTSSITVQITATTSYDVTVTDNKGCEIVDENGATLSVAEVPTAVATTRGVPICNGDNNAAIEINITGGVAPYKLYYSIDDVVQLPVEGIATGYVELTNISENNYTILEVRDVNNCDIGDVFDTTVVEVVEVNVYPEYSMSVTPNCNGVSVALTDESSDNVNDWQWTVTNADGQRSFSDVDPVFDASYSQTITIELISTENEYGCSDTLTQTHELCGFADCLVLETEVNVFTPNSDGVNDLLDFDPSHFYDECIYLRVYDRWGRTMYDSPRADPINSWDGTSVVDGQAPGGTYFYLLQIWEYQHTGSATLIRD